jgi:hypothetical protein
MNHTFPTF